MQGLNPVNPKSRITGGPTRALFKAKVLGRYDVQYFQCEQTGFIQTEDPYWLSEAYSTAITALDLGIVSRNIEKAAIAESTIECALPEGSSFLDFGGGYGMFTRLMRDRGYDFTHYDSHCKNLFASGAAIESLDDRSVNRFSLTTAWEVFEHIPNPRELLAQLMSVTDAILFSTELVPQRSITKPDDWWYFTPETGQHVSFYTADAISTLAKEQNLHFYSDGFGTHLLCGSELKTDPFVRRQVSMLHRFARRLGSLASSHTSLVQ